MTCLRPWIEIDRRRLLVVASLLLGGCSDPLPEVTDDGPDGTTTSPGTTEGPDPTTSDPPPADSTGSSEDTTGTTSATTDEPPATDSGSETGPICDVGTENCACDGGTCQDDLVCIDDVCVAVVASCGDGVVDLGEACDDANADPDDGCEPDCTISPGAAAVELGTQHTCALLHRGAVRCWGDGTSGRLGYGNTAHIGDGELPNTVGDVDIAGTAVQIAVGNDFSCARLDNGDVRCWGANAQGRLGLGNTAAVGDSALPSSVPPIVLGGPAIDISAGLDHACAVVDGGDVYCWGHNNVGQLGYGNNVDIGDNEDPVDAGPVPLGEPAVDVEAGGSFTCAILESGNVRCWGEGVSGKLGQGNTSNIGVNETPASVGPVDLGGAVVVELSTGLDHVCARTQADELYCWGEATLGRLGYGNTLDIGDTELPVSAGVVSVGGAVANVGLGETHTCVVTTGNEARCWGEATHGRIGNGAAATDIGDTELPSDVAVISVGAPVRQIAGGTFHTCAVLVGGGVKCWGRSNRGQLGYGNTASIGDDELPDTVGEVAIE